MPCFVVCEKLGYKLAGTSDCDRLCDQVIPLINNEVSFLNNFFLKTITTHRFSEQFFQCKIVNIFLPIIFSICFGCSKEPSH